MPEMPTQPTKSKPAEFARPGTFAGSRILMTRLAFIPLVALLLCSVSAWGPVMQRVWGALGMLLALVGMYGRIWCSLYIAGRKNKNLVQEGPYSMSRHPLYFYSFVGAFGVLLAVGCVTPACLLALLFGITYPSVTADEERKLLKIFGDELHAYRAKVPAFFPRLSLRQDAAVLDVPPRTFLNHLGSAIFFPILAWLFQWLHELTAALHLPVWVTLW